MAEPELPARRGIALGALRATLGRPPIWLAIWTCELLLAVAPALVFHQWMSSATKNRYAPGSLFANLDTVFRFDHKRALELLDSTTGQIGAVLALLSILLGCFCAGGWLQVVLERTRGESLQRFFLGGARYFFRFLRVFLFTAVALSLVTWTVYGMPWKQIVLEWAMGVPPSDFERLETLASERTVHALRMTQSLLYFASFGLVLTWGDFTRTRIALHDTSSAVWAGLCSMFTLICHPLRTLRPMLALFAVELLLLGVTSYFARSVEARIASEPSLAGVGLLLALGVLALGWRVVLRGARYHAAVATSRAVVRPISRPDPWKESFGPPDGPRYPLGGDEYGMSM
ncbi:MAG: hypothetical protein ACKVWV_18665 [Planctomycetota bacterium]